MDKLGNHRTRVIHFFFLVPILFMLSNCAVLTSSQIKEVEKFALASKQYTTLPGALPSSYGILMRNRKLLKISRDAYRVTDKDGRIDPAPANAAWQEIKEAYKVEMDFDAAGRELDGALSVLTVYSELLTTMASDDFTEALSQKLEKLGKQLDKATDDYNMQFKTDHPLDKIGGTVAKVVRAVGGFYLRKKQAVILQDTIEAANPIIKVLMQDVERIARETFKPKFQKCEEMYLGRTFKSVAINNNRISVCTTVFAYEELKRTRNAIALSDQVAAAAKTYRQAHQSLYENTRKRVELKTLIEEIETLKDEIDAAEQVEKNVTS